MNIPKKSHWISMLLLIACSVSTTLAHDEISHECEGEAKVCFEIEAKPDIVVEALTLLLPDTVAGIIVDGKGTAVEDALGKGISSVVKLVEENVVDKILRSMGVEKTGGVHEIYFGDNPSVIPIARSDEPPQEVIAIFEKVLTLVLQMSGLFAAAVLVSVVVLRVLKLGFAMDARGGVLNNLITQTPLIILIGLCALPLIGGVPLFSVAILSAFIMGSLIASQFGYLFAGFFTEYLLSESDGVSSVYLQSIESDLTEVLVSVGSRDSEALSEELFDIDAYFYRVYGDEMAVFDPSVPNFTKLFSDKSSKAVEACMRGMWHLGVNHSECSGYILPDQDALGVPIQGDNTAVVYTGSGELPVEQHDQMLSVMIGKLIGDDRFERADFLKTPDVNQALDGYLREVVKLAFLKLDARKDIFCMDGQSVKNSRNYMKDWSCAKFDRDVGEYSGQHAVTVLEAYRDGDSSAINNSKNNILRSYASSSWFTGNGEPLHDAAKKLSANIVKASFPNDDGDLKFTISGSSVISLLYDGVLKVSKIKDPSRLKVEGAESASHIEEIQAFVSGSISQMFGSMLLSVGLSGVDDEYIRRFDSAKSFDMNPRSEDLGDAFSISYSNMVDSSSKPLLIYVNDLVRQMPTFYGVVAVVNGIETQIFGDRKSAEQSLGKVWTLFSVLVTGLFYCSLLFLLFGLVSFLYCFASLVLGTVIRLFTHLLFIPIFIVRFIIDKDDEEDDDENVFFPESLKKILERALVDPLATVVSFVTAVILMSLFFTAFMHVINLAMMDWVETQNNIFLGVLDSLGVLDFIVVNFIQMLVAGWLLLKGNKIVEYMNNKTTQFIKDPVGDDSSAKADAQLISELMGYMKGLSGR